MRVTALAGGTGAARLLRGLAACVPRPALTVIGNTGDDSEVWGLHVSPDLDTVMYALAGRLDVGRGWGLAGDTFRCLEAMADHGEEAWFNLGDRDLATHLLRTRALRAGEPLSVVTAITIQDTMGVDDVSPIDAEWVADQARCVLEDMPVAAFKIGLLGSLEALGPDLEAVGDADEAHHHPQRAAPPSDGALDHRLDIELAAHVARVQAGGLERHHRAARAPR